MITDPDAIKGTNQVSNMTTFKSKSNKQQGNRKSQNQSYSLSSEEIKTQQETNAEYSDTSLLDDETLKETTPSKFLSESPSKLNIALWTKHIDPNSNNSNPLEGTFVTNMPSNIDLESSLSVTEMVTVFEVVTTYSVITTYLETSTEIDSPYNFESYQDKKSILSSNPEVTGGKSNQHYITTTFSTKNNTGQDYNDSLQPDEADLIENMFKQNLQSGQVSNFSFSSQKIVITSTEENKFSFTDRGIVNETVIFQELAETPKMIEDITLKEEPAQDYAYNVDQGQTLALNNTTTTAALSPKLKVTEANWNVSDLPNKIHVNNMNQNKHSEMQVNASEADTANNKDHISSTEEFTTAQDIDFSALWKIAEFSTERLKNSESKKFETGNLMYEDPVTLDLKEIEYMIGPKNSSLTTNGGDVPVTRNVLQTSVEDTTKLDEDGITKIPFQMIPGSDKDIVNKQKTYQEDENILNSDEEMEVTGTLALSFAKNLNHTNNLFSEEQGEATLSGVAYNKQTEEEIPNKTDKHANNAKEDVKSELIFIEHNLHSDYSEKSPLESVNQAENRDDEQYMVQINSGETHVPKKLHEDYELESLEGNDNDNLYTGISNDH